jgi:hypothetical protein
MAAQKRYNLKKSKLHVANQKQVGIEMSGKRLDDEQPFLVVKKKESNQIFKL